MRDGVIALKGVSHIYNRGTPIEKEVLSGIDFELSSGEQVGIIGVPGSGKTTFAMIMAGLLKPSAGTAKTPGTGTGKVGLVFQFPEKQFFCNTVFGDITFPLKDVDGFSHEEVEGAYRDACNKVDLDPDRVRDRRPSEMSSGEKRRVAIAGILVLKPSVLILDEPTAGLDPRGKEKVLDEIKRLSNSGISTVVISHDIEDILLTSKRVVLLEEGRIIEDGTVKEVILKLSEDEKRFPMLPFITELMVRLNKRGLDVRKDIFDGEEALREIKKALKI